MSEPKQQPISVMLSGAKHPSAQPPGTLRATQGDSPPDEDKGLALSVILITPNCYESLRDSMRRLRAQTMCDQMEIVIVAPNTDLAVDQADLTQFGGYQIVGIGPITSTPVARAAGVRRAHAPLVAFVEDHSYPDPGWAEALIEAHRGPWAAVGPVMVNANPATLISWANLIIEYGPWLDPHPAGPLDHLPGHNACYKRDILLGYGERLAEMFDAESVLHWDLRARGYKLFLAAGARTNHINFSTAFSWLPLRFHGGRLFAAARAREWSTVRRVGYALASPAIPLVRLWRLVGELRRPGRPRHLLPRILPVLYLGLLIDGLGEMLGYALGEGDAMRQMSDLEFHRERHLTQHDREALANG